VRSAKNLAKSRKLKEAVEKILTDYHNHFFDSLMAMKKLREVTKGMQEEDKRRNQLGLTDEEEAFYEILANHPNAVQDFDLIKEPVKKILAVKKVLRFRVKVELQEILDEVMEQAQARYSNWGDMSLLSSFLLEWVLLNYSYTWLI
jgi:type I restriction enzyme, R subunit